MSGHSKWAQIKRKKGAADKRKGQLFSKLSKSITLAAKAGRDPERNPALRLEVDRAKQAGMPSDTIDRAIKKGTGEDKQAAKIEPVTYEAYGPGGAALIVQAATDNKNRTSSEIKHILGRFEGSLGSPGSVAYLFHRRGQILVSREDHPNLENVQLQAIDLGAEDVREVEEGLEIYTTPAKLEAVKTGLTDKGVKITSFETAITPITEIELSEPTKTKLLNLITALEESENIINIDTNVSL